MRHNKKFNHLSRTASHRASMLANMAVSLIKHKRITTTVAKAKALKKYVEPLITKSKQDTTNSRRVVFSYLKDKYAVTELFKEVSVKVADRPGGYTRIIKTGFRACDAAPMCFIELVDYNEHMAKTEKKAKRTRRSKKAAEEGEADASEAPAAEAQSDDTQAEPKTRRRRRSKKADEASAPVGEVPDALSRRFGDQAEVSDDFQEDELESTTIRSKENKREPLCTLFCCAKRLSFYIIIL